MISYKCLKQGKLKDVYKCKYLPQASINEIRQERIHEWQAATGEVALQFSGHADGDVGLHFISDQQVPEPCRPEALANVISSTRAEGAPIRLIVLNACESAHTASALVSCDKSTPQPLSIVCWLTKASDCACCVFSQEFWRALDTKPGDHKAAYDLAVHKLGLTFKLACPAHGVSWCCCCWGGVLCAQGLRGKGHCTARRPASRLQTCLFPCQPSEHCQ